MKKIILILLFVGIGVAIYMAVAIRNKKDTIAGVAGNRIQNTEDRIETSAQPERKQTVLMRTTQGDIELELWQDRAPRTVENFLELIQKGFYNDTLFHRVIKGFMIQAGDPLSKDGDPSNDGTGGPGYTIPDELFQEDKLVRGVIAMANTGLPDSGGSQFFIVTAQETPWLNGKHTIFGKVISGFDVIDAIESSKTNDRSQPVVPVKITNIDIVIDSDKI